ncbi:MAG: sirohydrochlorin cobaltochelatase [Candidatus Ornithomonoglobus sp.]
MKHGNSKKAILVVSFGTSYNDTREATIGAIEKAIAAAFPDYEIRRAFTSGTIIKKLKERDGIETDNVEEALERLLSDGYNTVIVQPTHVMNGSEYDGMIKLCAPFEDRFEAISYGRPMLTSVEDYEAAVKAVAAETPEMTADDTAVIFVGHGTEHFANAAYSALAYRFQAEGYKNTFVGTVEAYPDPTDIKSKLAQAGISKVVLLPFMIVAGDHAVNDICGDEDGSWYTELKKEGYVVTGIKKGLGEYKGLQKLFADHVRAAIDGRSPD